MNRYFLLFAVCLLSTSLGGCARDVQAAEPRVTYAPIVPGQGERALTLAAPDETGSFWVWATRSRRSLEIVHGNVNCRPGTQECQTLPTQGTDERPFACGNPVTTRVCEFAALDAEPTNCRTITLTPDSVASVPLSGANPYAGVEFPPQKDGGLCLAGTRQTTAIPCGEWFWIFPPGHERQGSDPDLCKGGGSPAPGGHTWYQTVHGGPR